ncbi:YdhK family protein [Enterococcus rotai]|uniref:YdhK family protein n=1 Tax=Enterococcus rotai TaxID=118060 RepID=UPI0035C6C8E3
MKTSNYYDYKRNQGMMKKTSQPRFQLNDIVTLSAGYMPGMQGTKGTVTAAYDTQAYTVTYQPTNGERLVVNYKWITQEEIVDSENEPLSDGKMVLLDAAHQVGMEGARAVIESSVETTVYVVEPISASDQVLDQQVWLIEEDLMQ